MDSDGASTSVLVGSDKSSGTTEHDKTGLDENYEQQTSVYKRKKLKFVKEE